MRSDGDRFLGLKLAVLVGAMFTFGFAVLPPLYDAFCEVTGFGGKTAGAAAGLSAGAAAEFSAAVESSRTVRVEFVATVPSGAPWEFRPAVGHMDVRLGEQHQTHYEARNLTGQALVAQAVPSVAPGAAARYFRKLECFCFTTQAFEPHQSRELGVAFVLDRDLPEHVDTVTLSYTFFVAE